jgi:hypothetical protein
MTKGQETYPHLSIFGKRREDIVPPGTYQPMSPEVCCRVVNLAPHEVAICPRVGQTYPDAIKESLDALC